MTIRIAALVLSLALSAQAPLAARTSPVDFARLAGRWKVTAVAVGPGVGALAQDDPAYKGQILTIGTDRLAWENGTKPPPGAMLDDRCEGPVTAHQTGAAAENYRREHTAQLTQLRISRADPYAVECNEGQWGPETAGGAILFPAPGGRLAMTWYDGGLLLLERVR